ncbi:MAG TPA: M15 family metallopeptidase [Elusimicrobiales bacterium]|nr:M15 family metallopeptidase [Elusimicrobiales bacterium]
MPVFNKRSKKNLSSCHEDIELICEYSIHDTDFSVLWGHRSKKIQFELFKQGRKLVNGIWIIEDKKKIITNKDGKEKLSTHNFYPSKAFDLAPYPIDWKNIPRFFYLANVVKATASFLLNTGKISHRIVWGGDWKMKDYPHFELRSVK